MLDKNLINCLGRSESKYFHSKIQNIITKMIKIKNNAHKYGRFAIFHIKKNRALKYL